MMYKPWPRDPTLPYPLVYAVVEGKKPLAEHGGRKPTFTIQDVPEDRFEDLVDFMCDGFLDDEPVTGAIRLKEDPISLQEIRGIWMEMAESKCCLVAFADVLDENGKPRIAGANMLTMKKIKDKLDINKFQGKKLITCFKVLSIVEKMCDVFKKYNVDKCMTALGLSVSRKYYGHGLGKQILLCREPLCRKALQCPLITTVFTAIISQGLAASIDYNVVGESEYEKYEENGERPYKDLTVKTFQLMIKKL